MFRRTLISLAAVGLTVASLAAQDLQHRVADRLSQREASLIALRRDLHQHPEVSGAEARTAGVIAARLRSLGFEVRTGVGGHGVVGILRGARPGPTVAFRADMDAVASDAPDPVAFSSLTPGIRHICGHDVHVTVGLAIAEALAPEREVLAGTLMLIFQPAEENATGALAMLADQVFGDAVPEAIYAVHTAPLPVGQVGTAAGGLMAGRDLVEVAIRGTGDLEAAARAVARAIQAAGTVAPAEAMDPPPGFILTQVFSMEPRASGDGWLVRAQVTTADAEARARARETILERVRALEVPGTALEPRYHDRVTAGVTNDSALVVRGNARIRAARGADAVVPMQPVPPVFSEDFGFFQDHVPGVFYFLGVSNPDAGTEGMPHSPNYVADEGAILVGAVSMVAVLTEWLVPEGGTD